jgi:succinyl-diaminopimelate desuccinylase
LSIDLLERAAELVDIPSLSHQEQAIAARLHGELSRVPWLEVDRIGDNVVARTRLGRARRLLVAGHLDTVPPRGNDRSRVDGDVLWGLGAADMKGGIAVITELARTLEAPAVDVTYVLYACEEVERRHNGLLHVERKRPELMSCDAAVLAEPTGGRIEAGCQGTMRVRVELAGRRAHTARAWKGLNAIHRLGGLIELVSSYRGRQPVIEGCEYREALQAVKVEGGVAANVVPDEAHIVLNHRFAPDRSVAEAEAHLRELTAPYLRPGDSLEVEDASPGAAPRLDDAMIGRLVRLTGQPARAKLGWTDVSYFAARDVPAANFGPGDPEVAHSEDERVSRQELQQAHAVLGGLLSAQA